MLLISFLHDNPGAYIALTAVLGLIVGSFLNVVIHRLPLMMEKEWRAQCTELLASSESVGQQHSTREQGGVGAEMPAPSAELGEQPETFNLVWPRSRCPRCGHMITALENIPIVSYLLLRGRCSACRQHVSLRYPSIEALTAVLSALVAWHFGFDWQAGAALLLTWALICLTFIDFDHQLLPDSITLPFLWLGLTLSLFGVFVDSPTSIIGALAGYLVLWSVYQLFKLLTGKEGMGYGDFKLLATLGAWMGWQALPVIIVTSSVVGAAVGITLVAVRGQDRSIPISFGPYLAAAGWITLLWGTEISQAYLRWSGLAI